MQMPRIFIEICPMRGGRTPTTPAAVVSLLLLAHWDKRVT